MTLKVRAFHPTNRIEARIHLAILALAIVVFLSGCATGSFTGPKPQSLQSSPEGSGPPQSTSRPAWVNQQRIWDESRYGKHLKADFARFIEEGKRQIDAKVDQVNVAKQLAEKSISAREDYSRQLNDYQVMWQKLKAEEYERKAAIQRSFTAEASRAIAEVVRRGVKDQDPNLLVIQTLDRQVKTSISSLSLNYNTLVAPISGGSGSLNRDTIEKYVSVAVLDFKDAPGSPNSGQAIATTLTNMLAASKVFTIVERSRVEQIYEEQRLQLLRGDERLNTLNVGKMLGAKAMVVGEVNQFESKEQGSSVSISMRMVDVETGSIVYSGTGYWPEPIRDPLQIATMKILACLLVKLGDQIGFGKGYIGTSIDYRTEDGKPIVFVKDIRQDFPAESAGLKVGDIILRCNGTSTEKIRTPLQSMKTCGPSYPGQEQSLEIARGDQHLLFKVTPVEICR